MYQKYHHKKLTTKIKHSECFIFFDDITEYVHAFTSYVIAISKVYKKLTGKCLYN